MIEAPLLAMELMESDCYTLNLNAWQNIFFRKSGPNYLKLFKYIERVQN